MRFSGRMGELRRKAVIAAAFCAILGGFIPIGLHSHRWIAFGIVGAQAVLLVVAISLFVQSNKPNLSQSR